MNNHQSLICLLLALSLVGPLYGYSIHHRVNKNEKMIAGETVLAQLTSQKEASPCWQWVFDDLDELISDCKTRSETPRLTMAITLSYCTLQNIPCTDLFPLNFCLQGLYDEYAEETLQSYFRLVDDLCFYVTAPDEEHRGGSEFLLSPTLYSLMTFHQQRE